MFCRVVYTAKIGKDRDTREIGMSMNSKGELRLQFDRDVDWSEPIFVIIEPADSPIESSLPHTDLEVAMPTCQLPKRDLDDPSAEPFGFENVLSCSIFYPGN